MCHTLRAAATVAALAGALLLSGCSLLDLEPGSPECHGHPQPERCEQALAAVVAELTSQETPIEGSLRIEPVQCAHGRCWTWAYLTSTDGRSELTMGVDWMPNGEVSVSFVVP